MFELFVIGTFWFWALLAAEFCFLVWVLDDDYGLTKSFISTLLVLCLFAIGSGRSFSEAIHWVYNNPIYVVVGIFTYFLIGTLYVIVPYIGKWWSFVRNIREINRSEKAKWLADWRDKSEELTSAVESDSMAFPMYSDRIRLGLPCVDSAGVKVSRTGLSKLSKPIVIAARDAWLNSKGVMTNELLPCWKDYEKDLTVVNVFGKRFKIEKPTPDRYKSRIISWIVYWPPSLFWSLLNDPIRHVGRMIYESCSGILKKISDDVWKNEDEVV